MSTHQRNAGSSPAPTSTPERHRISRILPRITPLLRPRRNEPTLSETAGGLNAADEPKYSETENDEACEKLWSIYATEAERYDAALVESWRGDMEGMLIFSGLFSASVTAFLIESYRSLAPDSGDLTVQLLTRLSQQLAGDVTTTPPSGPFHVPNWSIICNTLWFTSLTLSLTCALLATLVEQWAREFRQRAGMRPSPVRRARVLSFLYFGVERFGMPTIVEVLPMLIHLALLLFFAGLVVFLVPVNEIVMALVAALLGTFVLLYAVITFLPTIALDCPYRTPLSGFAWNLLERLRTLSVGSAIRVATLTQAVIKHAFSDPESRDERAILWTIENLTDDNELLPFVEAIPDVVFGPKGFRQVNDHLFGSVLSAADQHASLGHRIFNLLRDAESLPDTDPLKLRKQVSSLRAIWALCTAASRLPSSRRGEAFLSWLEEANAFLGRFHKLPPGLQISCSAVIGNTLIESVQSYVEDIHNIFDAIVASGRPRSPVMDVRGVAAALEQKLPKLDPLSQQMLPNLQNLKDWFRHNDRTRGASDAAIFLKSIRDDPSWMITKIQNTCRMLQNSFNSGSTPYNLEMTSHHIFPELHSARWNGIRKALLTHPGIADPSLLNDVAVQVLVPAYQSERSPWRYQVASQSTTHLDYMMRMVLRLLPFLRSDLTLPLVYWYFANRTSLPVHHLDSFHSNGTDPQYFLETTDKVYIEIKFIESMRSVDTPSGTMEAVASYYLQGINSEQNIDQVYITALSNRQLRDSDASSSIYMAVKIILTRTVWGHLQMRLGKVRLQKVSTDSAYREIDEPTRIDLVKIIKHPFLVDYEPDIETETIVRLACLSVQHKLDEAYTATLTEILAFCTRDAGRASSLIPAIRAMCTIPEDLSFGADHQQPFIKHILSIVAYIRQTESSLYRPAILTLFSPIIHWFSNLSSWDDDSENFLHTAILIDALEIYSFEHGATQDRHAVRAMELRNHFTHLLWRMRNPDWVNPDWVRSRQMMAGTPTVIPAPEEDSKNITTPSL